MTLVPPDRLQPATLRALIEEFVTRDGTRYGHREITLEEMVRAVSQQLQTGTVVIVFDEESETCTMLSQEQYARHAKAHVPRAEAE